MRVARVNPRQGSDSTTGLEGAYANPDRTLVVTPTPNRVHPQSGYAVGGFAMSTAQAPCVLGVTAEVTSERSMAYSEIDIQELRRKANGTNMPGVSQGDRIRLRPVGTTWLPDEPDRSGNLDDTTFRAFDKACTCGAGSLSRAFSSFRHKVRADRTSAPWVSIARLP